MSDSAELKKEVDALRRELRKREKGLLEAHNSLDATTAERENALLQVRREQAQTADLRRELEALKQELLLKGKEVRQKERGLLDLERKLEEEQHRDTGLATSSRAGGTSSDQATRKENDILSGHLAKLERQVTTLTQELEKEKEKRLDATSMMMNQIGATNAELKRVQTENKRLQKKLQLLDQAPSPVKLSSYPSRLGSQGSQLSSIGEHTRARSEPLDGLPSASAVSAAAAASGEEGGSADTSADMGASGPATPRAKDAPPEITITLTPDRSSSGTSTPSRLRAINQKYSSLRPTAATGHQHSSAKARVEAAKKFKSMPAARGSLSARGPRSTPGSGSSSPSPLGSPLAVGTREWAGPLGRRAVPLALPRGRPVTAGAPGSEYWVDLTKLQPADKTKTIAQLQREVKQLRQQQQQQGLGVTRSRQNSRDAITMSIPTEPLASPTTPLCSHPAHAEIAERLKAAEAQIQSLRQSQISMKATEISLRETIAELEKHVADGPQRMASLTNQVSTLQTKLIEWQDKYEQLRKKKLEDERMHGGGPVKLRQVGRDKKIQEEIDNLKFHIYYAESEKDKQLADLRKELEHSLHNNAEVRDMRERLKIYKQSAVEDWLFYGDLADVEQ